MTVEVYPGPGTTTWQSTRFAATVNGTTAYVYGYTRTATLQSVAWANGNPVEASWLRYGADVTTEVRVTRIAGAITSFVVYPKSVATAAIVAGVLVLQVPPNTRLRVELNGDRRHTLRILVGPPQPAVGAATDWPTYGPRAVTGLSTASDLFTFATAHGFATNERVRIVSSTGVLPTAVGGDLSDDVFYYVVPDTATTLRLSRTPGGAAIDLTSIGGGSLTIYRTTWTAAATLTFGPGVHRIGRLFLPASNSRLHLQGGAVVIGSIDLRALQGLTITGPGILSGTFSSHEAAQLIPDFSIRGLYSMFYGNDGVTFYYNNTASDITVVAQPLYLVFEGIWSWRNVSVICPWTFECDGFDFTGRTLTDRRGEVVDCYAELGDDCVKATNEFANSYLRNTLIVGCANSCLHFNYWNQPAIENDSPYQTFVENVDCVHLGVADTRDMFGPYPTFGGTAVAKAWVDGWDYEQDLGRFDVHIDGLRVWGPHAGMGIMLENRIYPFTPGLERQQRGQIQDWTIKGLWFEFQPGQGHRLVGFDERNGPRDIHFSDVEIGGQRITAANFHEFFETRFTQSITIDGVPLVTAVDVCNRALSHIGAAAIVTSVSPPDPSAEAMHCAKFFDAAVTHLLELHNWSFIVRRKTMVAVTGEDQSPWPYCYEVPAGMLRLLGLTQEGTTDDYESQEPVGRYEMIANDDGVVRIYSDVPSAVARFTVYQLSPSSWPPLFAHAFTWHLASLLAGPIIKGEQGAAEARRCIQMANSYLSRAASSDSNQRAVASQQDNPPDWIAARAINRSRFTGRIIR